MAFNTVLCCLAIGVLIQNVVLMRQNQELRVSSVPREVEPGNQLNDLAAVTMDGGLAQIVLPASATQRMMVIAMSPGCPHSRASKDNWLGVTERLRGNPAWKVVWVSRDSVQVTRKYCERNGIPLNYVLANPTHRTYEQLGLEKVPHMIVTRSDGRIEKVWRGRLDSRMLSDVSNYLNISREVSTTATMPVLSFTRN